MKAKIIKTGEIVDVYHEPQHGQVSNIYKEFVLVNGRMWQENELEFIELNIESKDIDWEKELDFVKDAYYYFTSDERSGMKKVAEHFFKLGLKAQKGE